MISVLLEIAIFIGFWFIVISMSVIIEFVKYKRNKKQTVVVNESKEKQLQEYAEWVALAEAYKRGTLDD